MKTFEVTLKFSVAPWYTCRARTNTEAEAIAAVKAQAVAEGFRGRVTGSSVEEVAG